MDRQRVASEGVSGRDDSGGDGTDEEDSDGVDVKESEANRPAAEVEDVGETSKVVAIDEESLSMLSCSGHSATVGLVKICYTGEDD